MSLDNRKPDRIEDLEVSEQLAGVTGSTADRTVTLSGRCGTCGYLLESSGHKVSCGG